MSSDLILGIDAGGTQTTAWIATIDDPTHVVGRGIAGPANPQVVGADSAIVALQQATDAAQAQTQFSRQPFAAVCIGLAGADRDGDQYAIHEWAIRNDITQCLQLVNDATPVLYAATPTGCGVALISGTGSFAFGRRADGTTARAGGWGYLIGDEGSGYVIAIEALRAAVSFADGCGSSTSLLERLLTALGRIHAAELISVIYAPNMTRSRIAALCPVVFDAHEDGDPVATRIIAAAAQRLADLVAAVSTRLQISSQPIPLAITGGVLLNQPTLRERVQAAMEKHSLSINAVIPVLDPVAGALILAQRCALRQ